MTPPTPQADNPLTISGQDDIDRVAAGLRLLQVRDLGEFALARQGMDTDTIEAQKEYQAELAALIKRIEDTHQSEEQTA